MSPTTEELLANYGTSERVIPSPFLPEKCYDLKLDESELDIECQKIARDIVDKKLTLATYTTYLESFLTANTALNRKRGCWLLSTVINYLPKDFLTEIELQVLVKFYADRIKDHHLVISDVLVGIFALLQMQNLPRNSTQVLLRNMFLHIQAETCIPPDRLQIYKILEIALKTKDSEIKELGLEYVNGVIQLANGDRHPSSLLFLFDWLPTFYQSVEMSHLAEDCFDIVSCYFPIDLQSNPDEQKRLSRDNFSSKLIKCLCAVPQFGEFVIPFALDKLDSDLKPAILDSCVLLINGCSVFPCKDYEDNISQIWNAVKKHLFSTNDKLVIRQCIETICNILNYLSTNSCDSQILETIELETQSSLITTTKTFHVTIDTLLQLSNINSKFCTRIINCAVPPLLNQYYLSNDSNQEITIMEVLTKFSFVYLNFNESLVTCAHLAHVPQMLISNLDKKELRLTAWDGLTKLAKDLSTKMDQTFYEKLLFYILNENDIKIRDQIYKFIEQLSIYFKNICNQLIDSDMCESTDQKLKNYLQSLLPIVSTDKNLSDKIITKMKDKCFSEDRNIRLIYLEWYQQLPINSIEFLDYFVMENLKIIDNDTICFGYETAVLSSQILYNLVRSSDADFIKYEQLVTTKLNKLGESTERETVITICLLYGFLLGTKKEAINELIFNALLNIVSTTLNPTLLELSVQILANLVNKIDDEKIGDVLNKIDNKINVIKDTPTLENNLNKIIVWIVKAIAMRGSMLDQYWIEKMLARLETNESIAKYFVILLCEDKQVLCAQNNCNIKLLYRQKIFIRCLNKIKSLRAVEKKVQYSIAFINLLIHLPNDLFYVYFEEVYRILFECLESNIPYIILVVLKKLEVTILNRADLIGKYSNDLIFILLKILKTQEAMDIKYTALKCLQHFTTYTLHTILPLKPKVIYGIAECLDDTKRIVRTQARLTRLAWYQVGE